MSNEVLWQLHSEGPQRKRDLLLAGVGSPEERRICGVLAEAPWSSPANDVARVRHHSPLADIPIVAAGAGCRGFRVVLSGKP